MIDAFSYKNGYFHSEEEDGIDLTRSKVTESKET
jgi:hypothetical protein